MWWKKSSCLRKFNSKQRFWLCVHRRPWRIDFNYVWRSMGSSRVSNSSTRSSTCLGCEIIRQISWQSELIYMDFRCVSLFIKIDHRRLRFCQMIDNDRMILIKQNFIFYSKANFYDIDTINRKKERKKERHTLAEKWTRFCLVLSLTHPKRWSIERLNLFKQLLLDCRARGQAEKEKKKNEKVNEDLMNEEFDRSLSDVDNSTTNSPKIKRNRRANKLMQKSIYVRLISAKKRAALKDPLHPRTHLPMTFLFVENAKL